MTNNEIINFICQRCQKNKVLYVCHSCPIQFNKLCSDCDTYVHSIIAYKIKHLREKIETLDKYKYLKELQNKNKIIKELEEKNISQIDTINKLNSIITQFKNKIHQLIVQIQIFSKEKESYMKELTNLKSEIDKYKKENKQIQESMNENNLQLTKLNNELNKTSHNLQIKESELEEIKYYHNNKVLDLTKEKNYLLNELDNWNNKLTEQISTSKQYIDENKSLKNKIVNLEKENEENLKIISLLRKENKELIRRLNNPFLL